MKIKKNIGVFSSLVSFICKYLAYIAYQMQAKWLFGDCCIITDKKLRNNCVWNSNP